MSQIVTNQENYRIYISKKPLFSISIFLETSPIDEAFLKNGDLAN